MRLIAILPVLCCTIALILTFLTLFAGHKANFMEDHHLLTLNTSRIGTNLVSNAVDSSSSSNPLLSSLLNLIPDSIENAINGVANDVAGEVTELLGIPDFYSAHLLDYCEGEYTPTDVANATVSAKDIHKKVTACSKSTAMYTFDPTQIIEQTLSRSGIDITLADLHWPSDIKKGIDALRIVSKATFVLYVLAIVFIFVSIGAALVAIFSAGRLAAWLNVVVVSLAFAAVSLASALVTAVAVKGSDLINKYGNKIGIEARQGDKFLALTWAATVLMFLTLCVWSFETCCGNRRRQRRDGRDGEYFPKHG